MSRQKGNAAEEKAAAYLRENDYIILERNYYAGKMGEIDIIAQKEGVLHFLEVKSGSGFEAVYNITPSKIDKIIKSSYSYMKRQGLDMPFSIDAVIIQDGAIELIENITL